MAHTVVDEFAMYQNRGGGSGGGKRQGRGEQVRETRRHAGKLFNDDNFEEALVDLEEDEEKRKKAQEHPKQYLRDKGVQIPGNPEVEVRPDNWSISFCWKDFCVTASF